MQGESPDTASSSASVPSDRRTGRRTRRRVTHNLAILAAASGGGWAISLFFPPTDPRSQLSAATAYVGLGCVALSLALGPLNLLRNRPNPVSSDLRRDLGIWGAVVGLVHVAVGLTVHLRGKMEQYFVPAPEAAARLPFRTDAFGGANDLGVLAGAVLLVLLLLSSDRALRRLGSQRWKRWQQLNYVGALAILGHGVLYQLLERRRWELVALFGLVAVAALAFQLAGVRRWRRTKKRR